MSRRRTFLTGAYKENGTSDNTLLLCHFNGSAADETGRHALVNLGAVFSPGGKFGQCADCRNGGFRVAPFSDLNVGNRDFTIDFWVYDYGNNTGCACGDATTSDTKFIIYHGPDGVYMMTGYGPWDIMAGVSIRRILNAWTHIAIVRTNGYVKIYVNGKQTSSTAVSTSAVGSFATFQIGQHTSNPFNGLICEFRISNIARWTSDFIPSIKPY